MEDKVSTLQLGKRLTGLPSLDRPDKFALPVDEGDFFSVSIEQDDVDVAVRLFDSSGKLLVEVDSPTGARGIEEVTGIAERSGNYWLEVELLSKEREDGRYRIRWDDLRPAGEDDRRRVLADWTFARAEGLRRDGEYGEALEEYRSVLETRRQLGDPEGTAQALGRLGWMEFELDRLQEALKHLEEASLLYGRRGGSLEESAPLSNRLGRTLYLLGRWKEAEEALERSIDGFVGLGDPVGRATALNNLGNVLKHTGRTEEALVAYEQSLASIEQREEPILRLTALLNAGEIYLAHGRPEDALDSFRTALGAALQRSHARGEAASRLKLGETLFGLGQTAEGREHLEAALTLRRSLNDERGQALVLSALGTLRLRTGDLDGARDAFSEARDLFDRLSDPSGLAQAHHKLGRYHFRRGDLEAAQREHGIARELFEESGDRQGVASARYGIARAAYAQRDLDVAQREMEEVLRLAEDLRAETESLSLRTSYFASRRHYPTLYVDILMSRHREHPDSRYDLLALQATEAWRARGLEDLLREADLEIRSTSSDDLLVELRRVEKRLAAIDNERRTLPVRAATAAIADELDRRQSRLRRDRDRIRARIRTDHSKYWALVDPEAFDLSRTAQDLLDRDTVLLSYFLGPDQSYLWVISDRVVTSYALPARAEIEGLVAEYLHTLADPPNSGSGSEQARRQVGERLSRTILGPAAEGLDRPRWVVVPDGDLHLLPFVALPSPEPSADPPFVLDDHTVVQLPSASVLAYLRSAEEGRERGTRAVAVLADPVFERSDPRLARGGRTRPPATGDPGPAELSRNDSLRRLPHTETEARYILEVAPSPSRSAVGFEATASWAKSGALEPYRIVHFATHGLVHRDEPELSRLVLSRYDAEGGPVDGNLLLQDIYDLRLKAELVVLSACETGVGRQWEGEGPIALPRGFLYAGALRVVHSLWEVDDQKTAKLMEQFYRRLLEHGDAPPQALRQAQLTLRDEGLHPYYWAAFVHQGDWLGTRSPLDDDLEGQDTGGSEPGEGLKADEDLPPPTKEPPGASSGSQSRQP